MKRFSERFFNPRPAPTPADGVQDQYHQGQYSDHPESQGADPFDGQHEQQPYHDDPTHIEPGSHHGSALEHGSYAQHGSHGEHGPVESEVMAANDTSEYEKGQETHYHNPEAPTEVPSSTERSQLRRISLANGLNRNRLPTLAEVLARRTLPPVDLYCYYLFLQREGSEDSLDFWLDVQQHENLCRAYFKDLRKTGRHVREDWPGYYREARERGSIYTRVTGIELEREYGENGEKEELEDETVDGGGGYGRASDGEWNLPAPGQPRFVGDPDYAGRQSSSDRAERRSNLFKRGSIAPTVLSRTTAISRMDLVASAERIYARYLLPGSEKEIYLPPQLRINSFPLSSSSAPDDEDEEQQQALARVPDMFHSQKEYVFRTMEADVFPRFLRAKAFGNLTPVSALVRLSLGLLALWAGLATGFAFIFLDVGRIERLWVILPFAIAVLLIVSHQYELDPILALLQQSETTPFRLITVREKYVRKLLLQRAVGVIFLVVLISAALSVLFIFVPGHRL